MSSSEDLALCQEALQGPTPSPCIAQPWTHWMNGLFDTCGPDGTWWSDDSKLTSEFSQSDAVTVDATDLDLLSVLPPGDNILPELSSPTDSEHDIFDNSFMEVFTNLNDILHMAEPEVDLEPLVQESTVTTSTSKRGRKRKAIPSTEATPTENDDHVYSSKKAKVDNVRASTSSVSDIDITEVASPAADLTSGEKKTQKYVERRRKNNIASQKSRKNRKQKNNSLEKQAEDLEVENEALRTRIAETEALTKELKELLVHHLAGSKKK